MKKIIKIFPFISIFILGSFSSCANKDDGSLKPSDPLLSRGCWNNANNNMFFDGTSEEALHFISSRRFSKKQLPSGSVLSISRDIITHTILWKNFPETENSSLLTFEDLNDYQITIDDSFWANYSSCAFNFFSKTGEEISNSSFAEGIKFEVPQKAPDRRTYTWNKDHCLSILMIGNSFSDDAIQWVYQIAKSAGVENVYLGNVFYGSCRLSQHYNFWTSDSGVYSYRLNTDGMWNTTSSAKMSKAFEYKNWDFISFQESAQEIQSNESLYVHLGEMIQMAKNECPNAKIVWHEPWANPHVNYGNNTMNMFNDCLASCRSILEQYPFDEIITTGVGIQNARTSYIPLTRFVRDNWHLLIDFGRYVAGLTLFTQLTGISVNNLDYSPNTITAEEKAVAIEAAVNAGLQPRLLTQSIYTGK